jgi:LysM repeat protein
MIRLIQFSFLFLLFLSSVEAKVIECRVIIGATEECNPYSRRFFKAKKIRYEPNRKKLIVDKTLPKPLKPRMQVISVEDLIENYVKVDEPLRFKGTEDENYFKTLKYKPTATPPYDQTDEKNLTQPSDNNRTSVLPIPSQKGNNPPEIKQKSGKKQAQMHAPVVPESGYYTVKKGDTLSQIAFMFGLRTKELMRLNVLKKKDHLKIGQKLKIPLPQKIVDAMVKAEYTIQEGDYLIGMAKMFGITPKALADANHIKYAPDVRVGKVLKLPLPYKLAEAKKKKKQAKAKKRKRRSKFVSRFGKHRLRVTATAYTSHRGQTDKTPFLAAWNNRLRPGMKVIAVSRDLLYKYGMKNGTKVKIAGLPGYYRVRDKMNKRYRKRIDIYMGTNRRKALRWGRRSVVIYW